MQHQVHHTYIGCLNANGHNLRLHLKNAVLDLALLVISDMCLDYFQSPEAMTPRHVALDTSCKILLFMEYIEDGGLRSCHTHCVTFSHIKLHAVLRTAMVQCIEV